MRLSYKIVGGNLLLAAFFAFLFSTASIPDWYGFVIWYGTVSLVAGGVDLIGTAVCYALGKKNWGEGLLLSGLIFLLIGGSICSNV